MTDVENEWPTRRLHPAIASRWIPGTIGAGSVSRDVGCHYTSMKWNREEICRLLNARITDEPLADGGHVTIVHFEDTRMRFELWINEASVFVAADPERPVQGLPFFEISIPCTELAPVPRSGMPTGIGMYSGPVIPAALCFSITRRDDGSISLSGAWDGIGRSPTGTQIQ